MTVPILPGPFSFLAEAGQAVGSYAQAKEERKRHGEELAHRAVIDLINQVHQGLRPASVLADPEVKKLFKHAGFPEIPDVLLPQPQEITQRKTAAALGAMPEGGAAERAVTGVPGEQVAAAQESVTKLAGAKAEADIAAGLPQIQAQTEAAVAQAQQSGASLNRSIFEGAQRMLGGDKNFAKLSYEAATGALDYRIRLMMLNRENLTLERQRIADQARYMLEGMKEARTLFTQAQADYDKQKRQDMVTAGLDPTDDKAVAKYEAAHPPPQYDDILTQYLKDTFGVDQNEFHRILREGIGAHRRKRTCGPLAGLPRRYGEAVESVWRLRPMRYSWA